MRLSHNAREKAGELVDSLDVRIRRRAIEIAVRAGREFADTADVMEAYKAIVIEDADTLKGIPAL